MKKLLLPIIIAGLIISMSISPGVTYGQDSLYRRDWICCKCQDWFKHDYPKDRSKMGLCKEPECNILCPRCHKELGDLAKALEELKQRNRNLNKEYQELDDKVDNANKKFYQALMNITGEKDGSKGWNLDGLNGSMGKFSVALLSLASDFTGSGATTRLIDKKWFGTGLTLATNGIGIYQMATGPNGEFSKASDVVDAASDYGGTISDFLTLEFIQAAMLEIAMEDEEFIYKQMRLGRPLEKILKDLNYPANLENILRSSPDYLSTTQFKQVIKGLEKFSLLADIWALEQATSSLTADLVDLMFSWGLAFGTEKLLEKIQDEILKNNELMACIKRTQENINKGGTGFKGSSNGFNRDMALLYMTPALISSYQHWLIPTSKNNFAEFKFILNEPQVKSAISKIKQIKTLEHQILGILYSRIFPSFIPWIRGGWKKLKPSILIQLLQKTKAPFQEMIRKCDEMTRLGQSIKDELRYAVIVEKQLSDGSGSIGNSPLSEYEDGSFYITGHGNESTVINTEKWSMASNPKLPADKGRLNLIFPANVEWSVDIYTSDNKFYINRSSYSKHSSYDLAPGTYHFKFNGISVDNVTVEKGKETKLKLGILNMMSRGPWELYDESKKIYYTSGNKPVKRVFPAGTYQFIFENKQYTIQIKNGAVLKFDLRKPFVPGQ